MKKNNEINTNHGSTAQDVAPLDLVLDVEQLTIVFATGEKDDLLRLLPKYRGYDDHDRRVLLPVLDPLDNKVLLALGSCHKISLGKNPLPGINPFSFVALAALTDLGWYPLFAGFSDPTALVHAREAMGLPAYLVDISSETKERSLRARVKNVFSITLTMSPAVSPSPPELLGPDPILLSLRQVLGPDRITLSCKELLPFPIGLHGEQNAAAVSIDLVIDPAMPPDLPFPKSLVTEEAWLGRGRLLIQPAAEAHQLDRRHVHLPAFPLPYASLMLSSLTASLARKLAPRYQEPRIKQWIKSWTKNREKTMSIECWGYGESLSPLVVHLGREGFEIKQQKTAENVDIRVSGFLPALMEALQDKSLLLRIIAGEIEVRPRRALLKALKLLR